MPVAAAPLSLDEGPPRGRAASSDNSWSPKKLSAGSRLKDSGMVIESAGTVNRGRRSRLAEYAAIAYWLVGTIQRTL